MKIYTNAVFYQKEYLQGRAAKIPEIQFDYWARLASTEIQRSTFDRINDMAVVPEEVKMCCCEVAEKLYSFEAAKGESGLILQSYGNDGQTGTFKTDELTEEAVSKSVHAIMRKWLVQTGLMYRGVSG